LQPRPNRAQPHFPVGRFFPLADQQLLVRQLPYLIKQSDEDECKVLMYRAMVALVSRAMPQQFEPGSLKSQQPALLTIIAPSQLFFNHDIVGGLFSVDRQVQWNSGFG
jgi:hypothetical protein